MEDLRQGYGKPSHRSSRLWGPALSTLLEGLALAMTYSLPSVSFSVGRERAGFPEDDMPLELCTGPKSERGFP